jgi:cytoskeletal protein CcmA (bactofilin family)
MLPAHFWRGLFMALFGSKDSTTNAATRSPVRAADAPAMPGFTFIGPNTTVEATITGSDPCVVEGTIRGRINLTSDLRLGTKARVEASVHAKNVTVEGKVTGDISADERVELVMTATVDGNIRAPKIIVAEGARFRGSVDMGSQRPHGEQSNRVK